MAGPPVARIRQVSGPVISSLQPSMLGMLRQEIAPAGAPAFSAAMAAIFAAFMVHRIALGWGENTMALPAFRAIIAL